MTAIVTGTDGEPYVHRLAGETPVFVTEAVAAGSVPGAVPAGHVRLVAWLVPPGARDPRRARVRLPSGQIVEIAAEAVCHADNVARARIAPAHRPGTVATGPAPRPAHPGMAALRGAPTR